MGNQGLAVVAKCGPQSADEFSRADSAARFLLEHITVRITARHLGIEVLAISSVTDMAAGILDQVLTAEGVLETATRLRGDLVALLRAVVPEMEKLVGNH